MKVSEINIGDARYAFNSAVDIVAYANEQARLWQYHLEHSPSPARRLQGNAKRYFEQMGLAWNLLNEAIDKKFGDSIETTEVNDLDQLCSVIPLVDFHTFQNGGHRITEQDVHVLEKAVTSFRQRYVSAPPKVALRLDDGTQRTPAEVGELYNRVTALRREIEDLSNTAQQKVDEAMASVDRWKSNLEIDFSEIQKAYREQMVINEPVKLWKIRMSLHEKNRWRYLGVAIFLGLVTIAVPAWLGTCLFE
ncbi:hypothetical protein Q4610_01255 [Sphingobium sp. HBC34]|uniref:Uncharacterized protein n=1 Tax=Sphingobium cyanobacteriorum TaxID=3063954 RepID=A0ABT8ZHI5_9SPHN|nr:hypothetical protein [Sphingobium sp. HBC34]MDO7833661.1 hypothetical protein [Sphingobium sp. HBC34]